MYGEIVSLYVDDANLRLLVIRGKRVKKWAEFPLEPGLIKNNIILKEAEVAGRIKQLFELRKVKTKKIILGLSALHCLSRPITLPQLPREMLAEAVIREARRVLPVPPEQLYITWQPIPSPPGKTRVFLVAIPRRIADSVLEMLRRAGLKPYHMDLKPLVLARVVTVPDAIIIDMQRTEFDIVMMTERVPQPIRTVAFFNGIISRRDKLLLIKEELGRTISFYNSNNPEKPLAPDVPIFASGELTDATELRTSIAEEFGHPVQSFSIPLQYPLFFDPVSYMVNMGLTLKKSAKEARASAANQNILPAPYQPKPISLARTIVLPAAVFAIVSLIVFTSFMRDASASIESIRNQLNNNNRLLIKQQSQKGKVLEDIARLKEKIARVAASRARFAAAFNSLAEQDSEIDDNLRATLSNLSESMTLTLVSITAAGEVTIRGSAPNSAEALAYARRLDASNLFSGIVVQNIREFDGGGGLEFTLLLKKAQTGP